MSDDTNGMDESTTGPALAPYSEPDATVAATCPNGHTFPYAYSPTHYDALACPVCGRTTLRPTP